MVLSSDLPMVVTRSSMETLKPECGPPTAMNSPPEKGLETLRCGPRRSCVSLSVYLFLTNVYNLASLVSFASRKDIERHFKNIAEYPTENDFATSGMDAVEGFSERLRSFHFKQC